MKLGERQMLTVVKKVEFGVYLAESKDNTEEKVLLPVKQVPEGTMPGDKVEVFIYRDSKDRMIATTNIPKLRMGEVAELTVAQVGKFGAFLDWGLEKDLLLPFKQQKKRVKPGESVLVSLYIDKSGRLCATMNVYENLSCDSPYKKDDQVTGRVYEISDNFGAFVAVDNIYSALIPKKELYGAVAVGEDVTARVTQVKEDGRLDLSIRDKAYLQIEKDAEVILKIIDSYDGVLPFNDKVSPEIIKRETGMSKNEFKRGVGNLLKNGLIEITDKVIRRKGR
ncbi:MAG: S1 RNA-binding domain-containing protein [Lachnospiraceae bacterium]|nr:S1 RNA-binding domain-containing protein [Lachnospiraceae bacterium]